MNEHAMNIDDLISQYIDGELTGDAEAELHHRLSVSPEDRRRFREQIELRGIARDRRVLDQPTPAMRAALFARLEREEGLSALAASASAFAAPSATTPADASASRIPSSVSSSTGSRARVRAGDRPAIERRERRRRLVPLLLPFLVGVVLTAVLWQFLGDGSPTSSPLATDRSAVDTARQSAGIASIDSPGPSDRSREPLAAAEEPETSVGAGEAPGIGRELAAAGPSSAAGRNDDVAAMSSREAVGGSMSDGGTIGARGSMGAGAAMGDAAKSDAADADMSIGTLSVRTESLAPRSRFSGERAVTLSAALPPPSASDSLASPTSEGTSEAQMAKPMTPLAADLRTLSPNPPPADSAGAPVPRSTLSSGFAAMEPMPSETPSSEATQTQSGGASAPASAPASEASSIDPAKESVASAAAAPSTETSAKTLAASAPSSDKGVAVRDARDGESMAADGAAPSRGTVLASSLRQSVLVAVRSRDLHPELALRAGAEFDDRHEVYGVLGLTTIREARTTTTSDYRREIGGAEALVRTDGSTIDELRSEIFAGGGYCVTVIREPRFRAGAGAWAAYGERYTRVGAELPLSYQVGSSVRIEVTPTLQYATAHGATVSGASTTTSDLDSTTRRVVTNESEIEKSEIRAGIGIGVTVIID
jgi:hypothetical protein